MLSTYAGTITIFICFNAYVKDYIARTDLGRAETLRLLASDADAEDIQARDEDARRKGVNSVPTFLVAQQYVVSGAQPPEVWDKVIAELAGK